MPDTGRDVERDPAREFLMATEEPVIIWAHAADVSRDGSIYSVPERGLRAYVGHVLLRYSWGVVVGSPVGSFWWSTRWDLIEWAGPRKAFP